MRLTAEQLAEYDRNGFLVIPDLVSPDEIRQLKNEIARVSAIEDERVIREKVGGPRIIYGLHDCDGPTGSSRFQSLACDPRILEPAAQILGDDALYMFHSKCNAKEAINGAIWQWHQDFTYWKKDGIPVPNLVTTMVMLDDATEMGGCLYFIPGSHKAGPLEPEWDDRSTSFGLWTMPKEQMLKLIDRYGDPIAITGRPGTVAMFHPYLVHGSGHNMSARSRWQLYFVLNTASNRPQPVENSRPEYQVARRIKLLRSNEAALAGGAQ